jgi:predicted  nucleic acid-binding Zn-ribbon protein
LKVSRKTLLWITAGLGIALIAYSLVRHFTSFSLGEKIEKYLMDGIIFAALALFMYNRKLSADERKAREAAEQEKLRAEQPAEEEMDADEENLPHWERGER